MSKFSKLVQKQKTIKQVKKNNFNLEAITNANREIVKCPCDLKKAYNSCCGLIHKDISKATSPELLMKSRYSAYVLANINYLLHSHHSSTRPIKEANEILAWTKAVRWLGLEIIEAKTPINNIGFVAFKAHYMENEVKNTIHENSRFVKENNHWTYLDGKHS